MLPSELRNMIFMANEVDDEGGLVEAEPIEAIAASDLETYFQENR